MSAALSHNVATFEWTPIKEKAAQARAEGKSQEQAATLAGCSRKSIERWEKEQAFQDRIDAYLEAGRTEAKRILVRNAAAAAKQLVLLMDHGYSNHSVRLAAAKDVLDRVGLKAPEKHEHSGTDGQPLQPPTINVAVIDYRAAIVPLATDVSEPEQNEQLLLTQNGHRPYDQSE